MQHTLSLGAASARALCGRAGGRRTERHEKPLHPLRSTRHERRAMRPALRTFIPRQELIRWNTFSVRQRMRHEQKSWHPEKTSVSLRGPLNGHVITHQQRSPRCSAVCPPHLPAAGAWESSFAISTPLSAPEGDQIPEARRGIHNRCSSVGSGRCASAGAGWSKCARHPDHVSAVAVLADLAAINPILLKTRNDAEFQPRTPAQRRV